MPKPTLLDIAKTNGNDPLVGLIEEAIGVYPELMLGYARPIKGLYYPTLVRTALPTVAFRGANEGVAYDKGTYEQRLVQAYTFNPRWSADKAVADRHEDGAEAFIALEAGAMMAAAVKHLAAQFYYGVSNDAKGFPGLLAAYDASNRVVDAGGTTAATGSSCWLVRFGPRDVAWVWGQGGQLALSDLREESVADADDATKFYSAYVQEILAYAGLQVGSVNSAVRIKKLTADSGKGLTDALIYSALAKFPAGLMPDVILCSRRSLHQLRNSRTATNATGAPAPIPTDVGGIPIYATDAISDTESLSL